jgi:hypothetical protein
VLVEVGEGVALRNGLLQVTVVDAHVLVEVRLLGESLTAVLVVTLEGSFPRVRAQVVKEVVPLAEDHVAALEVALHHADAALRLLVLEAEDAEALGLGDVVVVNVDVVQVDVFAKVYFDILVVQNAFQEIFVSQLFLHRLFVEVNRAHHAHLGEVPVHVRHQRGVLGLGLGLLGFEWERLKVLAQTFLIEVLRRFAEILVEGGRVKQAVDGRLIS